MPARLVCVSNRVGPVRGAARAGGLAVALVDMLRDRRGLWFGWSGRTAEAPAPVVTQSVGGLTLATLDLSPAELDGYYNDFCNRCLWPLFHFRVDLNVFDPRAYRTYRDVNARFAAALAPLLQPDDLVWVHDYHLFPLASELRALGLGQRLGFFLHIPVPPSDLLVTLPRHTELMQALFDYDLVGFQTRDDLGRFHDYVCREVHGRVEGGRVTAFGRTIEACAFPIGIDVEQFQGFAFGEEGEDEYRRMRDVLGGRQQIIGVDRLDYSKGLARRLLAYEHFLESHSDARGQMSLLQIAPLSRGEVKAYRDFRSELNQLAGRINGRFGDVDWTPVRYINRAIPRRTLAGLYRASRVGMVTPMRDGMNLVAKEYVAAQDPEDPGVLVLSRFAGAALQMPAALIVNPYDPQQVAAALQQARLMTQAERRERYAELMRDLRRDDVKAWRERFLAVLAGTGSGAGSVGSLP